VIMTSRYSTSSKLSTIERASPQLVAVYRCLLWYYLYTPPSTPNHAPLREHQHSSLLSPVIISGNTITPLEVLQSIDRRERIKAARRSQSRYTVVISLHSSRIMKYLLWREHQTGSLLSIETCGDDTITLLKISQRISH
jgi:hypothetical protein